MGSSRQLFFASLVVAVAALQVSAQEWTRFRGPNGTGLSDAKSIPTKWTEKDHNWKVRLPGMGHSSPVLWGEKIFLLSADPQTARRYVLCINSNNGKTIWTRRYDSQTHRLHPRSSYASCTPAVDAEYVFVAWAAPRETTLMALDHEGNEIWRKNLGPWVSQHGFGTSPMLYGDLVILSNNQQAEQLRQGQRPGKSHMMAFNRATGEQVWSTPRNAVRACYTVPCVYQDQAGKDQLVCYSTGDGMYGLDPKNGQELWSVKDAFSLRTVNSPVVAAGLIFGSNGAGNGGNYVVAVRPGENAKIVYRIERSAPYVPTPIVYDGLLFLWYDKGIVTCVDPSNGSVHWQERLTPGFSGSPVCVGGRMYCIDEQGDVIVVAASKQFKELARNPLGEASRATPAVAGGRMYLRTDSHLISVGGGAL